MDPPESILQQYDREMRRDPLPDPGGRVERLGPIVRVRGRTSCVVFSELDVATAAPIVAEQADYFRRTGEEVEWKVFGHDRPANLGDLLAHEGFVPDEPETLVIFDLNGGAPGGPGPAGVEIRRVTDELGLPDAVAASDLAFGPDDRDTAERYRQFLGDPNQAVFVAYAGGSPIATGRVETPPGRSFASLWGGGTSPRYRRRGVYRALVRARAELARGLGYRYLTVDARETSRPILERLGFVPLTRTRAWVLRPTTPSVR